jgi:hypothetical protein
MTPADDEPHKDEVKRIVEEAEEGPHGTIGAPDARPETGPIEEGRVDAGPTGQREDGFRQAESSNRVFVIAAVALAVIVIVVLIGVLL